jgi:DNA-3-methyladenine glycosylase I
MAAVGAARQDSACLVRPARLRLAAMENTLIRCTWRGMAGDPLYEHYHDTEWGVPERDSRALWEKLVLDGFQAGLAWITILRKREAFRAAFDGFDPEKVARYGEADRARLMADAGIIRSNAKIDAAINGARIYLAMRDAGEDFAEFCWSFTDGKTVQNRWVGDGDVPAQTPLAVEVAGALKARGFKFVGPVIVYAWLQAVGIVNDHLVTCYRHAPIRKLGG